MSSNSSGSKSIFLVEDSSDIRDLITFFYKMEGYRIDSASDGREALEKLRNLSELPGVILLDLMMPGMDGHQFRIEQEKDPKLTSIPVLVMTADSNAAEKAAKIGAKGYLRKPVAIDALLAVAKKFCD
jgi:CheY-like chemotaxis protein